MTTIGSEVGEFSNLRLPNSTEKPAEIPSLFKGSLAYAIVGCILVLINTPIFINILRHRVLRAKNEYLLLAGLAGADMLAGWSTLIAGAYRLHLIATGEPNRQVFRWKCIEAPHFVIMTFSLLVSAGMLLVISLDRLIAVLHPIHYSTFTRKYALSMLGGCYIPSALHTAFILGYIRIFEDGPNAPTMNAICVSKNFDILFYTGVYARLALASLSVIVYVFVWFLFRKHRESMQATFPSIKNRLRNLQRHLSVTVGICALLAFVFYILPTVLKFTNVEDSLWWPLYWLLNCCNGVINVFVYSLRHVEIRPGLKLLFIGKELPSPAEQRLHQERRLFQSVTGRSALLIIEAMSPTAPAQFIPRRPRVSTSTCSTTVCS